jgi:hypothetical protein
MKQSELISRVNKSTQFEDKVQITDELAEAVNVPLYCCWAEQGRLTSYWVSKWYCTDTHVGHKVYFLDGEPVAISSQTSRKAKESFEWISKETYKKLRDYVLTFLELGMEEAEISIANPDEEVGDSYKIHYCSEIFDFHKKIPFYKGEKVEIIEKTKDARGYYISKTVKIKFTNGKTQLVDLEELDFPYNLTAHAKL